MEVAACINIGALTWEGERAIVYHKEGGSAFYPGYEILQAFQTGRENQLPPRMQKTLTKAQSIISGVSGSQSEMALKIHDLLCEHVQYFIDDNTDEDDCCIGAILNGKANCDGYSDAFLLLCGLKGIPVRLVTGEALKEVDPEQKPSHMWNLVLLEGVWRGVDVTWDDPDNNSGITYMYYNMGMDRMRMNYRFSDAFLPDSILQTTALHEQPDPEYNVATSDDVIKALRDAASGGKTKVILWMDEKLYTEYRSDKNPIWTWMDLAGVSGNVSHISEDRCVIVSAIESLPPSIQAGIAETEDEIIALMRAASGIDELRIYCSDGLYAIYRMNNSLVWKWLDLAGLSGSVAHSDSSCKLVVSEISSLTGIAVFQADSSSQMVSNLKSLNKRDISEIRIYCSDALYSSYLADQQIIWTWLKEAGLSKSSVLHSDERKMFFIYP